MNIRVVKKILTDQSVVFEVELAHYADTIRLRAPTEIKAREVAAQIRDAVNECLDDPVEVSFQTRIAVVPGGRP